MKHVCSHSVRRLAEVISGVALWIFAGTLGSFAHAAGDVVISQVYGGGGITAGSFRNDYVELFNRSADPVSLSGWCLQYAPATGFFRLDNNQTIALNGVIQAGSYYLVRLGGDSSGSRDVPAPDAVGLINIDAVNGQLVLLSRCAEPFTASEYLSGGRAVDFVGYGTTASRFEGGGPTPPGSNSMAVFRAQAGCLEVDSNEIDFSRATPNPRNNFSPQQSCANVNAPIVPICPKWPIGLPPGTGGTQWISARDPDGLVTAVSIAPRPNISASSFVPAGESGAAAVGQVTFGAALAAGDYSVVVTFSNDDPTPQTASCTIMARVNTTSAPSRIRNIQGTGHISQRLDQVVELVPGIVTAVRYDGFFMQDSTRDTSTATSEGIFVATASAPRVSVGDSVTVTGRVREFRPGGSEGVNNLTITQIVASRIDVLSSGNALPLPVLVSVRERAPPPMIIDDDSNVSPETSERFDADNDGIDFHESLEGMRVRIEDVVAVGPSRDHETPVLMDHHRPGSEGKRTSRGGVFVVPNDFNPERMILVEEFAPVPRVNVGATAPFATGVVDYSSGNFKLLVTSGAAFTDNALQPEVTDPSSGWPLDWLAVASVNVGNLHFGAAPDRFTAIARQIITNLRAPDIIALLEVQDSNGSENDAVVDASLTYQQLIDTIVSWGGPTYQYRQIDPLDDQDGGEPGGNSRSGYLFNPEIVTFVDRPGGTATSSADVLAGPYSPELSASPARIDPQNAVFGAGQKPLVAEFLFNGYKLFLIANQFASRAGDPPLFGRLQPPLSRSQAQRSQQATVVSEFVQRLHAADPEVRVIVFGGFDDFADSPPLQILKSAGLVSLAEDVTLRDRYTQIVDGNSLALDDILLSQSLAAIETPQYFDIVHVNSEFQAASSRHDPVLAKLYLPSRGADLNVELGEFVFDEAAGRYVGTMRVTNINSVTYRGPFHVTLANLPPGESVANPNGYWQGVPYVTVPVASLAAGEWLDVPVEFTVSPESFALIWGILAGEY